MGLKTFLKHTFLGVAFKLAAETDRYVYIWLKNLSLVREIKKVCRYLLMTQLTKVG